MRSGRLAQGATLLIAVLLGAAVTFLMMRQDPKPEPVPIDPQATTCDRAFGAAREITAYLDERAESDPTVAGHPMAGVAESERDAAWNEYIAVTGQYMEETVQGFAVNFGGEVQFLVDQFVRAGAWGDDLGAEVVVVNEIGIRNLATHLETAARTAGCEG
ncbi:MAG TPA: hypothetical protein VJ935_07345 [Acidimicrobiia bacterium]|nr:hypothetical protein [Acidimicrobiia bacterium]